MDLIYSSNDKHQRLQYNKSATIFFWSTLRNSCLRGQSTCCCSGGQYIDFMVFTLKIICENRTETYSHAHQQRFPDRDLHLEAVQPIHAEQLKKSQFYLKRC